MADEGGGQGDRIIYYMRSERCRCESKSKSSRRVREEYEERGGEGQKVECKRQGGR